MIKRTAIVVILLFGFLSVSCTAEELNDSTLADGLVAAIPFRLYESMIILDAAVDGSDPLLFIFDTGAGGTIISARTAESLGITGDEAVTREGAAGDAQIMLSEKHTITMKGFSLENVTLGIVELGHIDRRLGIRIDGVIGWKIMSEYAVRLNYDTMQLEIYDTNRYDYNLSATGYDIEVSGTALLINATAKFESGDTFTGRVLIDTGSGGSVSFNTPFSRENNLLKKISSSYDRKVVAGLSTDSYHVYTTILPSLTMGEYEFTSIPVNISFVDTGALAWPNVMGILGNDVLMRFNIFIDIQQRRIFLEPNQFFNDPFEVNCSGLALIMDESLKKVIVDYVYEASPADESGLKAGDEIIQINGVNASDLQLQEIRSMLSQNGKDIEILIERDGEQFSFLLSLRPLIQSTP